MGGNNHVHESFTLPWESAALDLISTRRLLSPCSCIIKSTVREQFSVNDGCWIVVMSTVELSLLALRVVSRLPALPIRTYHFEICVS